MAGRILVLRGGAIGDFLLTLPALHLLRDGFSDCRIEIFGYRQIASIAEKRFYADAIRCIEFAPLAAFFARNGNLPGDLVDYFASFDQIISYLYDPDEIFLNNLARAGAKNVIVGTGKPDVSEHVVRQLARPLERLALFLEDPSQRIYPSREDVAAALALLPSLQESDWVVLHPGSGSAKKNWSLAKWEEIGAVLLDRKQRLLIVGGEADRSQIERLQISFSHDSRVTFLTDQPLPVLGAVLQMAKKYIGHDTGISHLAAAAGCHCLLLFGPTDPDIWAPMNPGVRVLQAPNQDLECLEVRQVLEELVFFPEIP